MQESSAHAFVGTCPQRNVPGKLGDPGFSFVSAVCVYLSTDPSRTPKLLPLVSDPSSSLHSPQRRRGTQEEAAFLAAAAATSLRLSPLANTEEDGESAVLREGGVEEGEVDEGGGRDPGEVHQGARRRVMEIAAQECWYGRTSK